MNRLLEGILLSERALRRRSRTDVTAVQAEALVHGQSEGLLRDRGETSKHLLSVRTVQGLIEQPPPVPQGATGVQV